MPTPTSPTAEPRTYRLARPVAARMIGRGLVALGVLVALATLLDAVVGIGWAVVVTVAVVGVLLLAGQTWWLLRRAWVVRLTPVGYAVRLLRGVGVRDASWSEVGEATAAAPGGRPALVLRLTDGRATVLPMAALPVDREDFARDVRRRLRDAHTPADPGTGRVDEPDSAATEDSL